MQGQENKLTLLERKLEIAKILEAKTKESIAKYEIDQNESILIEMIEDRESFIKELQSINIPDAKTQQEKTIKKEIQNILNSIIQLDKQIRGIINNNIKEVLTNTNKSDKKSILNIKI